MNTNNFKCELCGEWFDDCEYWVDDFKVCEACYDDAVDCTDKLAKEIAKDDNELTAEQEDFLLEQAREKDREVEE